MQGVHMTVHQPGDIIYIGDGNGGFYAMRVDANGVLVPVGLAEALAITAEAQLRQQRNMPF